MGESAKGWADSTAKAQVRHAENMAKYREDWAQFFAAQAAREIRQHEAEVQAEEDMLP